jgi:hypothetical protein
MHFDLLPILKFIAVNIVGGLIREAVSRVLGRLNGPHP